MVIPVIGGLLYGPLIYKWPREARGHGVPEVMIAVADNGGRIRWQVSVVKALASALCIGSRQGRAQQRLVVWPDVRRKVPRRVGLGLQGISLDHQGQRMARVPSCGWALVEPLLGDRLPGREAAVRLWDHVTALAGFPGFVELKRSRRERPQVRGNQGSHVKPGPGPCARRPSRAGPPPT